MACVLWKPLIQRSQRRQERLFGIELRDVRLGTAGHLAMQVEHHVVRLHGGEDRVEVLERGDAGCGVGCHA